MFKKLSLYFRKLTPHEIVTVRNKILHLYLAPGEFIGHKGCLIKMSGTIPYFQTYNKKNLPEQFYLKCPNDGGSPYWDWVVGENGMPIPFYDKRAKKAARAVRSLVANFPFKPTNNFIVFDEVGR